MIALLMKLGLSDRIAKLVAYIGIPLLILAAFYFALDAYGDSRFEAGEKHADAKWQEASDKLIEKSLDAGTKADKAEAARIATHTAEVAEEKEKIDEAVAHGSSPLDVLFPSSM